ncbi:MAG: hypothetical protein PHT96_03815 [Syntrophorhabdaceae bacterium]|nr:hypothetical protein [Syntrophorhabdaceae bacterium]
MNDEDRIESLKKELLADCNPYPVDDIFLKSIEEGDTTLTDDLAFKLIKESPAWLGTKPIQKKITEWQYMLNNPLFDPGESTKAKDNLQKIGRVLAYEGQGRPEKLGGQELYRKYKIIESQIALFLKENTIEPGQRLKAVRDHFPEYNVVIKSGTPRHRTNEAIAVYVLAGYAGIAKSTIQEVIGKYSEKD